MLQSPVGHCGMIDIPDPEKESAWPSPRLATLVQQQADHDNHQCKSYNIFHALSPLGAVLSPFFQNRLPIFVRCLGAFLVPCYGWNADVAFERPVEGGLRFVPDAVSYLGNRETRLKYEMFRQLDPPAGQVSHWRLSGKLGKPLSQS